MVVIWSTEGMGCSGDVGQVSSSSSLVMTMSGRKMGVIAVIPHVKNGGCMEIEGVSDLGDQC